MTEKLQVYKCQVCGNMVEVIHASSGELVCCGQPMTLQNAGATDAATEKHVPVVKKTADGYKITVGSVAHPMEAKHYIEWIQIIADGKSYRKFLEPGQTPEAIFAIEAKQVIAREYCNIHGLWKA